jgi:hypothetical protein
VHLQIKSYTVKKILEVFNSVPHPHQLNADLDPAFHFKADLDPAFHFNFEPPGCTVSVHGPPWLYSRPLKLTNFDLNPDPDPTSHSNADPHPASK